MTAIRRWGRKEWTAAMLFCAMVLQLMGGFVTPAYADDAPAENPPSSDPAPESGSESTSTSSEEPGAQDGPSEPPGDPDDATPDTASTAETDTSEIPSQTNETADTAETGQVSTPSSENGSGQHNEGENGEGGESGENGETPTVPSDGEPSTITTGNATASGTANTSANTTSVDTNAGAEGGGGSSGGGEGGGDPQAAQETEIEVENGLFATTTASTTANTGDNKAVDPDGVNIFTGEGISSLFDVLTYNIALVDSSGEIMILQNPLAGELDLRAKILDVFQQLTGQAGTCTLTVCELTDALFSYIGENISDVERNTYAGCTSGQNIGEAEDGAVLIDTGNCTSSNITVTIGNLSALYSRYLIILMNQVGALEGDIILPEAAFFEGLRAGGGVGPGSELDIDNNADLTVHGTSTAEAGENTALGSTASTVDGSGNKTIAHAFTGNFVNQVNPPSCFIISVGGTWTGDVYQIPEGFARERTPYADIICGRGKTPGEILYNIKIEQDNYAKVLVNAIAEAVTGKNTATGQAVTIKPGDAQSFLYILNILNTTLVGQDWVFGLFTVSGDWDGDFTFGARPGASPEEHTAGKIVSQSSGGSSAKSASNRHRSAVSAKVSLTKSVSQAVASVPSVVEYTLRLINNGGAIYGAKLSDLLVDPSGQGAGVQHWDLGKIEAGEEIVITYSIEFKGNLPSGLYTNTATLTGFKDSVGITPIQPVKASASLQLVGGQVLGLADCPAYLTGYVSPRGANNPAQVELLETFLRDVRGEHIQPDGIYDSASIAAVERLQREYAHDILVPWGLTDPTGYVYYTTRKTINELYCNGSRQFPLTALQMRDIQTYRNGALAPEVGEIAPKPWSAADLPLFARFNGLPRADVLVSAPATTPLLGSLTNGFPLITLLRDIFTSIAWSVRAPHAQASGR